MKTAARLLILLTIILAPKLVFADSCVRDSSGNIVGPDLSCTGDVVLYDNSRSNCAASIASGDYRTYDWAIVINEFPMDCTASGNGFISVTAYQGNPTDDDGDMRAPWRWGPVTGQVNSTNCANPSLFASEGFNSSQPCVLPQPSPPMNLVATAGDSKITLTWNPPTGNFGILTYDILRGNVTDDEESYFPGVTGTSFTDTSVVNGTIYYYEVAATNFAGDGPPSNEVSATSGGITKLTLSAVPDFGKIQMGTTTNASEQFITVTNPGPSAVTFSSIELTTGTQFLIVDDDTTCALSASLAVGAQCKVSVVFNPTFDLTLAGPLTDTLNINYLDQVSNQTNTVSEGVSGTSLILLPTTRISQQVCGSKTLFQSTSTIGSYGCALTALTDALNYTSLTQTTPCALSDFVNTMYTTDANGIKHYYGNTYRSIIFGNVVKSFTEDLRSFNGINIYSGTDSAAATAAINSQLANNEPAIVGVEVIESAPGKYDTGHYVLVTGQAVDKMGNDTFSIDDPSGPSGRPTQTLLNGYNEGPYLVRGIVTNTPLVSMSSEKRIISTSDQSETYIAVDTNADVLVSDSNGNQTGYNPRISTAFNAIPSSVFFADGVTNVDAGASGTDTLNSVYINESSTQNYVVSVIGNASGPYSLVITSYDINGVMLSPTFISGIATAGSVDQYTIAAGGVVTPVATPTPIPTATPLASPTATPSPTPMSEVTLRTDKMVYTQGSSATITATVSSSYTLPSNEYLIIEGSLNGAAPAEMTSSGPDSFTYVTSALSGNSTFVATVEIGVLPSNLAGIDQLIASVDVKISASHWYNKWIYELEKFGLEIAKGILELFNHEVPQTLETDQINLIVNSSGNMGNFHR